MADQQARPGWYPVEANEAILRFWTGETWDRTWKLPDGRTTKTPPVGSGEPANAAPSGNAVRPPPAPVRKTPATVRRVSSRDYVGRLSKQHAVALIGRDLPDTWAAAYHIRADSEGLHFDGVVPAVGGAMVSWSDNIAMDVEDATRITATRLLALGFVGGLAFKKPGAFLSLATRSRGSLAIKFDGVSASELSVEVQSWKALLVPKESAEAVVVTTPAAAARPSVRERLHELAGLHQDGLVNQSEYESRRERILEDL